MLGAIIRERLLLLQGFICNWINLWFGFALYTLRGGAGRWRSWLRSTNVLESYRSLELVETEFIDRKLYFEDVIIKLFLHIMVFNQQKVVKILILSPKEKRCPGMSVLLFSILTPTVWKYRRCMICALHRVNYGNINFYVLT